VISFFLVSQALDFLDLGFLVCPWTFFLAVLVQIHLPWHPYPHPPYPSQIYVNGFESWQMHQSNWELDITQREEVNKKWDSFASPIITSQIRN
jgi:hypothetical protein